jgi:hypothetical protein
MSRPFSPDEPARQPEYQRAYRRMYERIKAQDESITWLLIELRAVQKRVDRLEKYNADTATRLARMAAVKLAHERVDEVRELEQRRRIPLPEAGDQAIGHPDPNTGL